MADSQIYYVAHLANSMTYIQGSGCYLLINGTIDGWNAGATIEPFNVVFDALPDTPTTHITDGVNTYDLNGITLTNTPIVSGATVPTQYSFNLTGETLTLERSNTAAPADEEGILSINGVTPINGNINIKVLN